MRFTKTLLTTALFGASVFSFQPTAWADTREQQLQQAFKALTRGDYQTAVKLWLPLAEQGDAAAQSYLGMMYDNGQGVKQDDVEAVKWYRKAAEQGDTFAQSNLGMMYLSGQGVQKDRTLAKEWLSKACDNGDQKGCFYKYNLD